MLGLSEWWHFVLMIVVLTIAFVRIAKASDLPLVKINKILQTLIKEFSLSTDAARAQIWNLILGVIAGIISFTLVAPSFLSNLGLKDDENTLGAVVGGVLFLGVFAISGYVILQLTIESKAFKNHDRPLKKRDTKQHKKKMQNSKSSKSYSNRT